MLRRILLFLSCVSAGFAQMTWNAPSSPALTPYAALKFVYETRSDTRKAYLVGSEIRSSKRLQRIQSYFTTTLVREYVLDYNQRTANQRPDTERSLLTGVEEFGAQEGGQHRSFPKLAFDYDAPTTGWQSQSVSGTPNWKPAYPLAKDGAQPRGTGVVDLNGDGRPDFVFYHRYGSTDVSGAYLNTANGWVEAHGAGGQPDWRIAFPLAVDERADAGTRFIDYNGDGLIDFFHAYRNSNGTLASDAFRNTGSGWASESTWALPVEIAGHGKGDLGRRFIDVNGDGPVDLVYNYASGGTNTAGAYLNNFGGSGGAWVSAGSPWAPLLPTASEGKVDNGSRFLDLNGDGLPDQLTHYNGEGTYVRRAQLNTGSGWAEQGTVTNNVTDSAFAPAALPLIATNSHVTLGVEIVDLNGDGLSDILQNLNSGTTKATLLNTGAGWVTDTSFEAPYELGNGSYKTGAAFADVNGDGINDLV